MIKKAKKKSVARTRRVKKTAKATAKVRRSRVVRKKSATATIKKRTPEKECLSYDTPIGTLEKEYGFKSDVPPSTKVGDVLKKNGFHAAARILQGMSQGK